MILIDDENCVPNGREIPGMGMSPLPAHPVRNETRQVSRTSTNADLLLWAAAPSRYTNTRPIAQSRTVELKNPILFSLTQDVALAETVESCRSSEETSRATIITGGWNYRWLAHLPGLGKVGDPWRPASDFDLGLPY